MNTKTKVILAIVALLAAFASGRWLAPTKTITETKTVEVVKEVERKDTQTDKDTHKTTTTTEVDKPDGTKEKTTTVTEDSKAHTAVDDATQLEDTKVGASKTTVERGGKTVNISALGAISLSSLSQTPSYGLSVNTKLLGPLTIGAFGLSSGVVGFSLGIDF